MGALDDWKQGQLNDKVTNITLRVLSFPGINYTVRWIAKRDNDIKRMNGLKTAGENVQGGAI